MERAIFDKIRIRNLESGDLPRIFQIQLDPESNQMAVTVPRTAEAFNLNWTNVLRDPTVTAKSVLVDGVVVGYICCFQNYGTDCVGYWIDRNYWGKGIATRALGLLLAECPTRPLHAYAAMSNLASLRVLEKCGFVMETVRISVPDDRHPQCEEAVLILQ